MRRTLLCCCLALSLPACFLQSPAEDVRMGRQVADTMEAQIGRFADPALSRYVEGIGRRLLDHYEDRIFEFEFALLDQPEPNAFAAPGGFVYVSRGLLALAQSEDELAGVIGHEIVHVEQRHTARQLARQRMPSLLTLPGRAVGAVVSTDLGNLINAPITGLGALGIASYGRSQEAESDEIGQRLAASTGYDPSALARILDRMERFGNAMSGESRRPSFFDTHPPTPTRVADIESGAEGLQVGTRPVEALDDAAFVERLDGLVVGNHPAHGEFRDEQFVHPELDVSLEFPDGWQTINTPSLAGAVAEDNRAFVFYGYAGFGARDAVERLAADARQRLEREAGLQPTRDEPRDLDGRPAHLLVYSEDGGSEPVHLFMLWLAANGRVHQLVGVAPEAMRDVMRGVVDSLRPLTLDERRSFVIHRLRLVEARAGDTLVDVIARMENLLDIAATAVLNDVTPDEKLEAGRVIKVVVREEYVPGDGVD